MGAVRLGMRPDGAATRIYRLFGEPIHSTSAEYHQGSPSGIAKCRNDFRRGQKIFFELVARSLSGEESEGELPRQIVEGGVCDE